MSFNLKYSLLSLSTIKSDIKKKNNLKIKTTELKF